MPALMRLTKQNENMTTKHTHTSGPWTTVTGEDWDGATVQTLGGRVVAYCDGCDIPGATKEPTTEEAKANARLIATAPEMLEALERLTHPMASDEDLQHALAIIAKAKGGEA